ncbi:MAG TPA: hypothetical protein VGG33_03360 [Polyangia bacterium]
MKRTWHMRRSGWWRTSLLVSGLAVGTLLPGVALAEPPRFAQAPANAQGRNTEESRREERRLIRERLRNEVLDQMRAMRMWKLTEELKLDQATAAKVFPILAQFDDQARDIGRERKDIGREVYEETKRGQPNDAKMRQLIDRLLANQQKRTALDDQRFAALRPALTPLQQAKLLLLLPRLEDDFRRRIRDAMMAQKMREEQEGALPGGPDGRAPRRPEGPPRGK